MHDRLDHPGDRFAQGLTKHRSTGFADGRQACMSPLWVGDAGAPAFGTLDPDLWRWLEVHQRVLVTDNRKSMPRHIADHTAAGGRHWGIFLVRKDVSLRALADTLYIYWDITNAEQWRDLTDWLPI